jgi:hypothetical protein
MPKSARQQSAVSSLSPPPLSPSGKNDGILRGWGDDQLVFEKQRRADARHGYSQDRNRLAEPLLRRHLNCQV